MVPSPGKGDDLLGPLFKTHHSALGLCPYPSGWPSPPLKHTGSTECVINKKGEDGKLVGKHGGRWEREWWMDMIKIHCLNFEYF